MTYIPKVRLISTEVDVHYPESDSKPMADNTLQFDYILKIKSNLEILYREEEVFIAGDLFWYPVEGKPKIVIAPDVLVAHQRPKGFRASYKQWMENNIAPSVVFEVLSPSNTPMEMLRKLRFCESHGVQEFIIIDPYENSFVAYIEEAGKLEEVHEYHIWKSPKMGVTIEATDKEVLFFYPNGRPFLMPEEIDDERKQEKQQKEAALEQLEEANDEIKRLKAALAKLKNK